MATVAIIAVLAVIAVVGYGRWISSSRTAEATEMVTAIKSAQETYFGEVGRYLDVSKGIKAPYMYPAATPGPGSTKWGATCSTAVCSSQWTVLGVAATAPVRFGYATVADGDTCDPDCRGLSIVKKDGSTVNFVAEAGAPIKKPWYIVTAVADQDGDGKFAIVVGFSFNPRLITDREGE